MSATWTTDLILADDSSAPHKWSSLSRDDRARWGLCQDSGKDPYPVQVDLTEPAFKYTCPSGKFSCKQNCWD